MIKKEKEIKEREGETSRWYPGRELVGGYQTTSDLETRIKAKWKELKWLESREKKRKKGERASYLKGKGKGKKGDRERRQFRKDLH